MNSLAYFFLGICGRVSLQSFVFAMITDNCRLVFTSLIYAFLFLFIIFFLCFSTYLFPFQLFRSYTYNSIHLVVNRQPARLKIVSLYISIIFSFFFSDNTRNSEFFNFYTLLTAPMLLLGNILCAQLLGHEQLFATLWTGACLAHLSTGLFRQEYWTGLPFLPPGDLPHPGSNLRLMCCLHCGWILYPLSHWGSLGNILVPS